MRKVFYLSLISISSFFSLSMNSDFDEFRILDRSDFEPLQNQTGPALTSMPGDTPYLESYSEWHCFPKKPKKLGCLSHYTQKTPSETPRKDIDSTFFYLTLELEHQGHFYTFEYPTFRLAECQELKEEWAALLRNQNSFCILAAEDIFVENKYDEPFSFWVAYGIKTLSGKLIAPLYELDNDDVNSP